MPVSEEVKNTGLVLDKNNIWRASHAEKMSYPEEGNNYCFAVEDNSFWFKHRNDVIYTLTQRFRFTQNFADVGGGNGFQVKFLAEKYPDKDIFLIEPGYAGCLNAKKRGVKEAYNIFFQEFPFDEKKIDAVGLFDVIEHIEDDKAFLASLAQYLPSGSHIFITVPAHQWLWSEVDDESGHYRRYNLAMFEKLAKDCNLEFTYGSYIFSYLPPIMGILRAIPFRISKLFGKTRKNTLDAELDNHTPSKLATVIFDKIHNWELSRLRKSKMSFGASCAVVLKTK
ncbi:Methyltransferase type 11 [Emticicia oligotrophica DSM 17448]|uniref:Methyltransferase type 11 n=1 Tax=Emticicia oligotrophica (strain DSM 17448 / CIP 109782 / MTCC 6937 / GPTSA100-15) TaxID=929562 RepID=A0ABM5N491_EMTOG|nr:methyltransferase domain-containing protein [Emticicia oligotrophica]AFK04285.1 Methyltransferase type 11 [Emticicia oligotrophica DSM 17448]